MNETIIAKEKPHIVERCNSLFYTRIEPIPGRPLAFVASCNVIQRQGAEWGE